MKSIVSIFLILFSFQLAAYEVNEQENSMTIDNTDMPIGGVDLYKGELNTNGRGRRLISTEIKVSDVTSKDKVIDYALGLTVRDEYSTKTYHYSCASVNKDKLEACIEMKSILQKAIDNGTKVKLSFQYGNVTKIDILK